MNQLLAAVMQLLKDEVPPLEGRVYDGLAPLNDWRCPLAVVDVAASHNPVLGIDAGFELAIVTIRITDELTSTPSTLATVADEVQDVLTRRDATVPALDAVQDDAGKTILEDWRIEDVGRLSARTYPEAIEGHRLSHMALEFEVTGERA